MGSKFWEQLVPKWKAYTAVVVYESQDLKTFNGQSLAYV